MDDDFAVGADHPALPGHFPGRPIVPGVVILNLIIEGLRKLQPDRAASGVKKVKFLRVLTPGETVRVEWRGARFRAFVGEDLLAEGQLLLA